MEDKISKKQLLNEKFINFKNFLRLVTPPKKHDLLVEFEDKNIEDLTMFILSNYKKDTKLSIVASEIVLKLDIDICHLEKLERYLNFFVSILDL